MSKIILFLLLAGFVYMVLFHKPRQHSTEELTNWFDQQLVKIANKLEQDIELEKAGHYPHQGAESFASKGEITYHLLDKHYGRFELSQHTELTAQDIRNTDGYRKLQSHADSLGLQLELAEVMVDGDGVDGFNELDEFIADIPRYYTVKISGWTP